jgi:hypothetical protein
MVGLLLVRIANMDPETVYVGNISCPGVEGGHTARVLASIYTHAVSRADTYDHTQ